MKKNYTLADSLEQDEAQLRHDAEFIMWAKEAGFSAETLNRLVEDFAIAKRYYDELKEAAEREQ